LLAFVSTVNLRHYNTVSWIPLGQAGFYYKILVYFDRDGEGPVPPAVLGGPSALTWSQEEINEVGRCTFTGASDPGLTPRGFQRLNRKYDGPLSNVALTCKLRLYDEGAVQATEEGTVYTTVGRCRFNPG